LEFSTLAACREYDGVVPGAGVVTGIGIVQGREVAIHANDASVKGGAWYPHTVKKVVRLLDVALENRLPVIHICDSAGGFPAAAARGVSRPVSGRAGVPQPGQAEPGPISRRLPWSADTARLAVPMCRR
jgi:acetyl-CoA carboxylase carboxyltransferase component